MILAQILKPGMWIYDDDDIEAIRIHKVTIQSGWLIPLSFVITFDYILKKKTAKMLSYGNYLLLLMR